MNIWIDDERLGNRDWAKLIETATDALQEPGDSYWFDEDVWKTHTLVFSTPDFSLTDDYLGDWSNYRCILRDLTEEFPDDVEDAEFGHWTFSRFKAIKVRVIDDEGQITEAFTRVFDIAEDLKQTALYDEDDYYELEEEVRTRDLIDIANDNQCSFDGLVQAMDELNAYYQPGYGFDLYKVTEDELLNKARQLSVTFQQHVDSGPHHHTEHCYYCARAVEGIPA